MLKIDETQVYGWEAAIRGMRNPMNSWDKSDSVLFDFYDSNETVDVDDYVNDSTRINRFEYLYLGPNDFNLMKRLSKAGTDHRKFMRMIIVYCDVLAPLYWWKEFDTYKVGTVVNSCSTMHKIQAKEFTLDDFSHEHLEEDSLDLLKSVIFTLNNYRTLFNQKTFDDPQIAWWQMIQLLPSPYNQKRTVMLNYEVLANIYKSRKNHKLDEWHTFCDWIKTLPYHELITCQQDEKDHFMKTFRETFRSSWNDPNVRAVLSGETVLGEKTIYKHKLSE